MKKRIAAAILWFYVGWFVGSLLAFALGLSLALGPILATAAAAFVAGDPGRLIWDRTNVASSASSKAGPATA